MLKKLTLSILLLGLCSCNEKINNNNPIKTYPDITVVGAMKNVMWKGELEGSIYLDTIPNKKGLYGLGPENYLTGELLINNGKSYVSKVTTDSTMAVQKTFDVSAPFFVYSNIKEWNEIRLDSTVKSVKDIEEYINQTSIEFKKPFAIKMTGKIASANIHIQNLPKGTTVSSPEEAHQGQVNYQLENEEVTIIGFFSREHKGIFTHHDSNIHLHLITKDESKMGHLDAIEIEEMKLYLPFK